MAGSGLRVAIVGATGALGSELLACLDASALKISELRPVATDCSLGQEIEFRGETCPVETELRSLRGLDLVFLCAPPAASLDFAREALRSQVSAIDLSGALAANDDVPLRMAVFGEPELGVPQPL